MTPARIGLWLLLSAAAVCARAEPGEEASAPWEEWRRVDAAEGNIQVFARDGAAAQTLAVWAGRGLQTLESAWKTEIPFHHNVPLRIRVDGDVDDVSLRESRESGRYRQEILVPATPERQNPWQLAEALTRAFTHRLLWRHAPDRNAPHARRAPDGWVAGQAPRLLDEGVRGVLHAWFEKNDGASTTFPESLHTPDGAHPPSNPFRAEAFLVGRLLLQSLPPDQLWAWMAAGGAERADSWVEALETGDLRGLHIHWDLWLEAELPGLASEFRVESITLARLKRLRHVHPARLGATGLPPRPLSLDELIEELDRPGLDTLLSRWMIALQPLSFRQSPGIHDCVTAHLEAGRLLRQAARARGHAREKALTSFHRQWKTATDRYHQLLFQNRD